MLLWCRDVGQELSLAGKEVVILPVGVTQWSRERWFSESLSVACEFG